jgi:SpoVK/Ycf46/Vps4 family AAA+-type ATPase
MSARIRKRVTRKQPAPLQEISTESAILAPYLIRFYLATANAKSEALSSEIFKHLIGQIVWPADALRRITACFPKKDGEDYDEPPHWLSRDVEGQSYTHFPTAVHPVDKFLSEKNYPFHTALQMLYIKRQDWLRNVLHVSLAACQQTQNALDQTKIERLNAVGETFDWSADDLALATLALHTAEYMSLCEWLDQIPDVGRDAALAYSRVLAIDRPRLRACFRASGALATSGLYLIQRGHAHTQSFADTPQLHPKLIAALDHQNFDAARLTDLLFNRGQPSALNDEDFCHLLDDSGPLATLLRTSAMQQEKGINVLIYGPPGTGKTEFARWLADTASLRTFEVPTIDPDAESGSTDPINDRLGLVRSSQRLMRGSVDAQLLFDEAEDAFPVPLSVFGFSFSSDKKSGHSGSRKAWINQLLEETSVPIIWISNAIDHMDPAFLRRFTYHLEMRRPSHRVRLRIAQRQAKSLGLDNAVGESLAAYADASPAAIGSALRFALLAGATSTSCEVTAKTNESIITQQQQLAEKSLRAGLAAAGLKDCIDSRLKPTRYDPTLINIAHGVTSESLLENMKHHQAISLCLYGVPGTGKTSFAEHIAERLDKPLIYRRASDLQSKWLGETEKNLRSMFAEAQSENAVLLLDEADSFLFDRTRAEHSWERSQVNELLQSMERFEGIFIAATNLIETLDKAALRRFAFKLEFLPLTREQRHRMMRSLIAENIDESVLARVDRMDGLTAGDFAVIARQQRLSNATISATKMLEQLEVELLLREPRRGRGIGFVC